MHRGIMNLIKLTKENPGLEVIVMVHYEAIGGDEHTYWSAEITSTTKEMVYRTGEHIYFGMED